jgi:hypothetical protein
MVQAAAGKYRCNLERFGAPPWACRILILVLVLLVAGGSFGVAFFTASKPLCAALGPPFGVRSGIGSDRAVISGMAHHCRSGNSLRRQQGANYVIRCDESSSEN